MHRRSLIASCRDRRSHGKSPWRHRLRPDRSPIPENTLYMDLKQGRVVIQMLPDLAPKARGADQDNWRARASTTTRRSIA